MQESVCVCNYVCLSVCLSVCLYLCVCLCVSGVTSTHNMTVLSGSTVTLDCQPPQASYSGYFEWRYYSSGRDEWIYSQPPPQHNDADFSATRYHKLGDYGLQVSSVNVLDAGVYACHFLTGDVFKFSTVIIIGETCWCLSLSLSLSLSLVRRAGVCHCHCHW